LALYKGNVQFKQDNLVIHANRIKVFTHNGGLKKIYIYGKPAKFTRQPKGEQQNVIATANRIEYFANSEILHMYDEALLQQGQQKFSGKYIQYNSRTSQIHANGDPTPENQNGQGRVKAVITPKRDAESP
jgi:lipopolysaccharide export system protein LptA